MPKTTTLEEKVEKSTVPAASEQMQYEFENDHEYDQSDEISKHFTERYEP